jgi:hypothetical protein
LQAPVSCFLLRGVGFCWVSLRFTMVLVVACCGFYLPVSFGLYWSFCIPLFAGCLLPFAFVSVSFHPSLVCLGVWINKFVVQKKNMKHFVLVKFKEF